MTSKLETKKTIKSLVGLYVDTTIQNQFASNKKSHISVWNLISEKLDKKLTSEQCKIKIKNLKAEYFQAARQTSGSGKKDFEFFKEFDTLYGKKPQVAPRILIDSLDADLPDIEVEITHDRDLEHHEQQEGTLNDTLVQDVEENEMLEKESPVVEEKKQRKRKSKNEQRDDKLFKYLKERDAKDDRAEEENRELNKSLVDNLK